MELGLPILANIATVRRAGRTSRKISMRLAWRGVACDVRLEAEAIIGRALGFAN
jgi:hypothetical protein